MLQHWCAQRVEDHGESKGGISMRERGPQKGASWRQGDGAEGATWRFSVVGETHGREAHRSGSLCPRHEGAGALPTAVVGERKKGRSIGPKLSLPLFSHSSLRT
jgi:hypothetical protein